MCNELISKFKKVISFLLCSIVIFSKCTWVVALKDKKVIIFTNTFEKPLDISGSKPDKKWVENGSKFYMDWLNRDSTIII